MIALSDVTPDDVSFTWVDDRGKLHSWLTLRMQEYAVRTKMVPHLLDIDLDYAEYIRTNCGIEPHRYDRISQRDLVAYPVIYVTFKDRTHKLVDGNHRYLKAAMTGRTTIPAYIFDYKLSRKFEVNLNTEASDFLRIALKMNSGIK